MKTQNTSIFSGCIDSYQKKTQIRLPESVAKLSGADVLRCSPFFAIHLGCIGVFWVGYSPISVGLAIFAYLLRMFAITAFYHRYFAHRAFATSRWLQFIFAFIGNTAAQRGPLWWAAHHRFHHRHSDGHHDLHSPKQYGFWWSHLGWFISSNHFATQEPLIRDWKSYRELRFLDRYDGLAPLVFALFTYGIGEALAYFTPSLRTNGPQMLVWMFCISTVLVYHFTFSINSLSHKWGTRRFATKDDSRNNWLLAMFTLGEGWHNNHHHYPSSARQGFYWWEFDITYYVLKLLSTYGLVWDLRPVPARVTRNAHRSRSA